MERAEARYSGYVQGVGFRFTTKRIAAGYRLAGYVKNLPDGSVEVVAEGARPEIERFLAEIASLMSEYIEGVQVVWGESTGAFTGFGIRF